MSRGRFSWLVEQQFEEVGLVCLRQGGWMLQVFVGAVCELLRCLGNCRPLHVRCRGLVSSPWVGRKVWTAVGTSPLRTALSTSVCLRAVMSSWVAGDCVSHPACCAMVWVGFQSVRVSSPLYRGHTFRKMSLINALDTLMKSCRL